MIVLLTDDDDDDDMRVLLMHTILRMSCAHAMRRAAQPAGARRGDAGARQIQQGAQGTPGCQWWQVEAEGEEGEAGAREGRRARRQAAEAGQSRRARRQAAEASCQEVRRPALLPCKCLVHRDRSRLLSFVSPLALVHFSHSKYCIFQFRAYIRTCISKKPIST